MLNDFNRLNKGRTQLARQQDESEDDFYLRLVAMGNVEADPSAIEKQIQTDILIKAKKNMLELKMISVKQKQLLNCLLMMNVSR